MVYLFAGRLVLDYVAFVLFPQLLGLVLLLT